MGVKVTPPWRNPVSTDSMISYYLLFRVGDLCELFRFFSCVLLVTLRNGTQSPV